MDTTPTDLDRIKQEIEACAPEFENRDQPWNQAGLTLVQVSRSLLAELAKTRAAHDETIHAARGFSQMAITEADRLRAEIAHLTRERDEVLLWLSPKTKAIFHEQWTEKRATAPSDLS